MQRLIPFWFAVLINVNIVIGAGFFLQVQKISVANGFLAPVSWILCGLLMLPLVYALAQLAQRHPTAGGIYIYSREELGPIWGVIAGWSYYLGATAANAVVMHTFTLTFLHIPFIAQWVNGVPNAVFACDMVMLLLFSGLNCRNIELLERLQVGFTVLKLIPIVLILCAVPVFFSWGRIFVAEINWQTLPASVPMVLFAYIGIEACTSIMSKVKNSKKNAYRLIFTSFALIAFIYAGLQLVALGIYGTADTHAFFSLPSMLFSSRILQDLSAVGLYLGLLASFLAGFYGMFYFNNWNLYTMAHELKWKELRWLVRLNRHDVPVNALMVQSCLIFLFLTFTPDDNYMIAVSAIGTTLAYILSAASFFVWRRSFLGALAIASCGILFYFCLDDLLK
jgi:APA family basic amino acid/polyamine antiporter